MPLSKLLTANDVLTTHATALYQSTFVKDRVLNFLNSFPTANRIQVIPVFIRDKVIYALEAYNEHGSLGRLVADFPCPDQCIPPNERQDFVEPKTHFEVAHLYQSIGYPSCVFFNVQTALLANGANPASNSFVIYAILIDGLNLHKKDQVGDNAYISIAP